MIGPIGLFGDFELAGERGGLPAGPIMSLPARVLEQRTRPIGMGIFYTVFYAGMLAGPAIGGRLSTSAGSASAALDFGAVALLVCPVVLWLFRHIVARRYRPALSPMTDEERDDDLLTSEAGHS